MFRRIATAVLRGPASATTPRTFVSFARPLVRPTVPGTAVAGPMARASPVAAPSGLNEGPVSIFDIVNQQRRFKSRGNTYQPSMLKRKRRAGFLARLRTRGGRKILERRRAKGRWFLTY